MLFGLFITLGVGVLSVALRSYESSFSQKIGALGILTASFLAICAMRPRGVWSSFISFSDRTQ